ncbi:MAG TPA: hypothetical protein PKW63_17450 [Vicinamibacterales bacterium]|jgi:hypothetical protein|nr:hypothetical protein [Acidobacteriota bacterium]HQX83558.1 hypothetical protein [Vicinamibacterales bacterium]
MRLSGVLPVMGRRVVVALGVAGLLMVATSVQAQTAAPAQAAAQPEPPDPLKFNGATSIMVLLSVKQGQEATFESAFNEMKAGLAGAAKPEFQAQAKTMQFLKVDAVPPPDQPVLYLLFLDPPVTDLSYNITQILYYGGAFDVATPEARKKVDDLYAKFTASLANQNIWPIVKK